MTNKYSCAENQAVLAEEYFFNSWKKQFIDFSDRGESNVFFMADCILEIEKLSTNLDKNYDK